ncbi:MAG: ImmA/IrrE family metallo-endopeptidase [Microcoleaceae cyanobacterium]
MGILRPYTHYSKAFIERQANVLLQQMESTPFAPTWPLESASVADFLDLGVVWDCIPPDGAGDIAARILPTQRMIEINETILDMSQGFIESTLSHEIGHWVLHIDGDAVDAEDLEDEDEPFVCRGATDEGQLAYEFASTEWQAQHFAACLLMPQFVLQQKLRWRRSDRWPDH